MNKKIFSLILLTTLLVCIASLPFVAFAGGGGGGGGGGAGGGGQSLGTIVDNAASSLTGLAAGLSTIAFIVAGIMYLSAAGNPSRLTIAKGALIAAVIGIVIVVLATGAKDFVSTFFGL